MNLSTFQLSHRIHLIAAWVSIILLLALASCNTLPASSQATAVISQPPSNTPLHPTLTAKPANQLESPTTISSPNATPSLIPLKSPTTSSTQVITAQPTQPSDWQTAPIIPTLSSNALKILRDGITQGNNPRAFAKIGDCESATDWFLADFDKGPRYYGLGPYTSLQPVIGYFSGSFQRKSLASARGFTAASALSTFWSDPKSCQAGETPLACEYRIQKPAVAFIMLGTNDVSHKETFEANMRKIIEQTIAHGTLPVLATKADNLEGDQSLNASIARLAAEYDIPLWNFWLAVQPLPSHGLVEDGAHLTHVSNHFEDPAALQTAWALRNLEALQILGIVMQAGQ